MNTATLFVLFVLVAIYILEPDLFQTLPERVILEIKMINIEIRLFLMRRKLKRQLDKDFKEMKKLAEEFTKEQNSVK